MDHVLPGAVLRAASVSEQDNRCYLLTCDATGARLLIDAADHAGEILSLATDDGESEPRIDHVVTTHRHWDHHRALPEVVAATGASTSAGAPDADELPVVVDRRLDQGDVLQVGDLRLKVIALRGHTPGSIALAWTDGGGGVHLFTGDSLFPGGVGNTWGNADDFASLIDDVEHRLFDVYPDEAIVYPGHGETTTLGAERGHLPEWRERGW